MAVVRVEGLDEIWERCCGDLVHTLGRVLEAVEPGHLLGRSVKRAGRKLYVKGEVVNLSSYNDFVVLAAGKASGSMAAKLLRLLEGRPVRGVAVMPPDPTTYAEALNVIRRRKAQVPENVLKHLGLPDRIAFKPSIGKLKKNAKLTSINKDRTTTR